jgi:hypothetical protein
MYAWSDGNGYWSVFGFVRKIAAGNALVLLFGQATTVPMRVALTMFRLGKHDAAVPPIAATSGRRVLASHGDLGSKWTAVEGLWSTISGVHK